MGDCVEIKIVYPERYEIGRVFKTNPEQIIDSDFYALESRVSQTILD
jgi:hypothetical protein